MPLILNVSISITSFIGIFVSFFQDFNDVFNHSGVLYMSQPYLNFKSSENMFSGKILLDKNVVHGLRGT